MNSVSASIIAASLTALTVAAEIKPELAEIVSISGKTVKLNTSKLREHTGGINLFSMVGGPPICLDALLPGSVSVFRNGTKLEYGKDYIVNYRWGRLGTAPGLPIKNDDEVQVSFSYRLMRIDSIVRKADGSERLVKGKGALNTPVQPPIAPDETRTANIFVSYNNTEILPVKESAELAKTATAKGALSKTLARLKSGKPVKIVCWGDSVTFGEDASPGKSYPLLFEKALKEIFPGANITVKVVAVSGSGVRHWLEPEKNPFGGQTDRCRWEKIAAEKPDLITVEFVNDAGSGAEQTRQIFAEILKRANAIGAELVLITPHFAVPAWTTGYTSIKDNKPRQYDKAVREFAMVNNVSIADVCARWEHLEAEGIPYPSLLKNSVNHPDDRGHVLFAEELIKIFK